MAICPICGTRTDDTVGHVCGGQWRGDGMGANTATIDCYVCGVKHYPGPCPVVISRAELPCPACASFRAKLDRERLVAFFYQSDYPDNTMSDFDNEPLATRGAYFGFADALIRYFQEG